MVSVAGNYYSVLDTTRKRLLEVQNHPHEVRIFEDGVLVASHPVLNGKNQRRIERPHRSARSQHRRKALRAVRWIFTALLVDAWQHRRRNND